MEKYIKMKKYMKKLSHIVSLIQLYVVLYLLMLLPFLHFIRIMRFTRDLSQHSRTGWLASAHRVETQWTVNLPHGSPDCLIRSRHHFKLPARMTLLPICSLQPGDEMEGRGPYLRAQYYMLIGNTLFVLPWNNIDIPTDSKTHLCFWLYLKKHKVY